MSESKWFHRGKEARSLGQSRDVRDGRLSPESRAEFLAGWDEQDRLMRPAATEEQREKTREGLRRIRRLLEIGL